MKNIIITAFLLIICLFFTACALENVNSKKDDANLSADVIPEEITDTESAVGRPNIPDGTNYSGYEFRVLIPGTTNNGKEFAEVYAEQETGDPLNDAVYRRNRIVEELLNIKIITIIGDVWHKMPNDVKKSVQAGDDDYDAIDGAYQPALAYAGCLYNLYNVPNIDLSKPWWDQRMIETLSYKKSKLYYISGDMGYYDKYAIACIMFNKRLFDDNGVEYPYEKVRSGAWTLDEFSTLVKNAGRDLNGDGKMDENDLWGLTENSGAALRCLFGCDERIIELDNEGIPYFGATSERHIRAVTAIGEMLSDRNNVLIAESGQLKNFSDFYEGLGIVNNNGQAWFMGGQIIGIPDSRDMDDDFGILPFPKLDLNQKEYHSWTGSYGNGSAWSIPVTNTDLERAGMIFEALAGYSTDIIVPALIDVSLKSKFTRDEESAEMLEIIFKSKIYDFAVEYGWGNIAYDGLYHNVYSQLTLKGPDKFVSSIEKETPKAETQMAKWIEIFDAMN